MLVCGGEEGSASRDLIGTGEGGMTRRRGRDRGDAVLQLPEDGERSACSTLEAGDGLGEGDVGIALDPDLNRSGGGSGSGGTAGWSPGGGGSCCERVPSMPPPRSLKTMYPVSVPLTSDLHRGSSPPP
jgi:hypothetical protein